MKVESCDKCIHEYTCWLKKQFLKPYTKELLTILAHFCCLKIGYDKMASDEELEARKILEEEGN